MFISIQIPKTCISYNITKDAFEEQVYSFISYWSFLSGLKSFELSPPYAVLAGAFRTLGELYENTSGELMQAMINE